LVTARSGCTNYNNNNNNNIYGEVEHKAFIKNRAGSNAVKTYSKVALAKHPHLTLR
jgi:riboflavin biosynthesis pyrimidine reductase